MNSTQSCFILNYYRWHFWMSDQGIWNYVQSVELSSSFEAAGTYMVTEHRTIVYDDTQGLDWFLGLSMVFSSNFNSMPSVGFGDNTINWNFAGSPFIPLFQINQQRFCSHWANLTERLARSMTNVASNFHQHNYRRYTFQSIEIDC